MSTLPPPRWFRSLALSVLLGIFVSFFPMGGLVKALDSVKPMTSFLPSVEAAPATALGVPKVSGYELARGGSLPNLRSVKSAETRYGLVAILVSEDVWEGSTSGKGFFSFLGNSGLRSKVQTYAQDVQASLPWTKTLILTVSSEDDSVAIQSLLERLYFEGNPQDSDLTQLRGVVTIGTVPLPVVNQNGYRSLSMLPYTDFKDPAFVVDGNTQDFVPNPKASSSQPEVWHGVIQAPVSGQEGLDLLGAYLDRNHAFHLGEDTAFDSKVFLADLVTEQKSLNSTSYAAYDRFLQIWEDLVYGRYSSKLVEQLYTQMADSTAEGDGLDNDGDGQVDEEAANGLDEDGDGLIDEDLGDGFYGIDNDNDGRLDEDRAEDNNNDGDWRITNFLADDAPFTGDQQTDEDPPGDATGGADVNGDGIPDGDGCAGLCKVDDNGDASDADGDGYPNGMEILLGSDWKDGAKPWTSVKNFVKSDFKKDFADADSATAWLAQEFTDDQFFKDFYQSPSCLDSAEVFHPEWDDDEDGFCDEDGSTQLQIWADATGVRASGTCAYNDADCDGSVDEDPSGLKPEGAFENLPDIASKTLLQNLTKTYAEIFDQAQGVWNRIIKATGRYRAQATDAKGNAVNDYDSPITLIAKKDSVTLQYLRRVNDTLEKALSSVVKNHLAVNIPVIGALEISGTYTALEDDGKGNLVESDPKDFCKLGKSADLNGDACLQFLNSASDQQGWDSVAAFKNYNAVNHIFQFGRPLPEVSGARECTLFSGSDRAGGQLVQFNSLYSSTEADLDLNEVRDRKNCVPEFSTFIGDIPDLCSPATASSNIKDLGGAISAEALAKRIGGDVDTSGWEVGPEACYEFRELTTYNLYAKTSGGFNDWLSDKIRKFRKNADDPSVNGSDYADFLKKVEEKEASYSPRPDEVTLRKHFHELDLFASDPKIKYTVTDMMKDLGYGSLTDDQIDMILALWDPRKAIVIEHPLYGEGLEKAQVQSLRIQLNPLYLNDSGSAFTDDLDSARLIPSTYEFIEPRNDTLNAQIVSQVSPNLPIDKTRRIVFIDANEASESLNYVNVFDAHALADVQAEVAALAEEVKTLPNGSAVTSEVEHLLDSINLDQLEDALTWYRSSIDEKHAYILSHYLGGEQPILPRKPKGYEIASVVARGSATSMQFAFNGSKPETEEDWEYLYRSPEAAQAALSGEDSSFSAGGGSPSTSGSTGSDAAPMEDPVSIFEWPAALQSWSEELTTSLTHLDAFSGEGASCGSSSVLELQASDALDSNSDGIPDGASATVALKLSTEYPTSLQANNGRLVVSVQALDSSGHLNTADSYTQVNLDLVSGEASIALAGSSTLGLAGGVATFTLLSQDAGAFSLQANATNRDAVADSGVLKGETVDQVLVVSAYRSDEGVNAAKSTSNSASSMSAPVFVNELPADGRSKVVVRAELRNSSGTLIASNSQAFVHFALSSSSQGTLEEEQVQLRNGQAETSFTPSFEAGELSVTAELQGVPSKKLPLSVYAGDPVRLSLTPESLVLPVGSDASTLVALELLDAYGNLANHGFYSVTLAAENGLLLNEVQDEDPNVEGTQVSVEEGHFEFSVLGNDVGAGTVSAFLTESPDLVSQTSIELVDDLQLEIQAEQPFMEVGTGSSQALKIHAVDAQGAAVTGFEGRISLSLDDPAFGTLDLQEVQLKNGEATVHFTAGERAGRASVIAEGLGLEPSSVSLVLKPGAPTELRIRNSNELSALKAGEAAHFFIESFDANGNLVSTDSSTTGTLRLTDLTRKYGHLSTTTFTLKQGRAKFTLTPDTVSGRANIVATASGLLSGTWGGDINYELSGAELSNTAPQALYMDLLGAPYGDVSTPDYLGGWMLMRGRTQAISTLMAEPEPKTPLLTVDAHGHIGFTEQAVVTQTVSGGGRRMPVRISWRSFPENKAIGDLFFVLEDGTSPQTTLVTQDSEYSLIPGTGAGSGTWILKHKGAGVARILANGQVLISNPDYRLVVNAEAEGLGLGIVHNTDAILTVQYPSWDSAVTLLDSGFDWADWKTLSPGLYVRPSPQTESQFVKVLSGHNSTDPQGLAWVSSGLPLPESFKPKLGYNSLETAQENGTVGWEKENKNILLFAAGNSAGNANLFYPSVNGVLLGDPTVRLTRPNEVNGLGFTEDIGTLIDASPEDILSLLSLDYNNDGREDVLAAFASGRVQVLQNYKAADRLQDRGTLLNIDNGIAAIDHGDFNNDGRQDLAVVTQEPCAAGEVCLYVFENQGNGGFSARNIALSELGAQPKQIVVADLNGDDYDDLVLVDEDLKLYAVWNDEGSLSAVQKLKDFGLDVDASANLSNEVALSYTGLEAGTVRLPIEGASEDAHFSLGDAADLSKVLKIQKNIVDDNGASAGVGDTISTTIYIENISGSALKNIYLSDAMNGLFSYDAKSLSCTACGTAAQASGGSKGYPFVYGPFDLGVGKNATLSYTATVGALPHLKLMVAPHLADSTSASSASAGAAELPEIGVSIVGNSTQNFLVLKPTSFMEKVMDDGLVLGLGARTLSEVNYSDSMYTPADPVQAADYASSTQNSPLQDDDGDGIPDFMAKMDGSKGFPVPSSGVDFFKDVLGANDADGDGYYSAEEMYKNKNDADGDGLTDLVDPFQSGGDILLDPQLDLTGSSESSSSAQASSGEVQLSSEDPINLDASLDLASDQVEVLTTAVDKVVNMLTCQGGCLALPGSVAFLAPGFYHDPFTGTTLGYDPGTPVFGLMPYPATFVCTGQLCYASQAMRLYIAPTTTLGLGLGVCVGPYPVGQCWAVSIPLLQSLGICDAINGFLADSLSKATSFASSGGEMAFNVNTPSSGGNNASNGLSSSVFNGYSPPVVVNSNVQVPGFPSIFTEWWKAQKLEFFKMLDLPDITFVYPDPKSLKSALAYDQDAKIKEMKGSLLGMEKFLNMANGLPLIDIQTKKVTIYYPDMTDEDRELAVRDLKAWVEETRAGWENFKAQIEMQGTLDDPRAKALAETDATVQQLIAGVEANLEVLESYQHVPEQILKIRNMQAEYASVIVCYLNTILEHTAGYLSTNLNRMEQWIQMIVDMREMISQWQVLVSMSSDFMDSCDKCTNQRFSAFQLLLNLFVFVPDLPVLELPKLPDITIDVSNIQAGVNVIWPEFEFVPHHIDVPKLPRLVFPNFSANANLDLDLNLDLEIPVLPRFDFDVELPPLPALSLPNLPSLPPAPELPKISPALNATLKIVSNILKVVCVIRQGFIPTTESMLKGKIEEITERPGGVVLPSDLAIKTDWPSFHYADGFKNLQIATFIKLTPEFSGIYDLAERLSALTEKLSSQVGDTLVEPVQKVFDGLQNMLNRAHELDTSVDVNVNANGSVDSSGANGSFDSGLQIQTDTQNTDTQNTQSTGLQSNNSSQNSDPWTQAKDLAEAYHEHPLVAPQLLALQQNMQDLAATLSEWKTQNSSPVHLVATQENLALSDPRLHRYNEIASGGASFTPEFLSAIEGTPLAGALNLRDLLLAQTQNNQKLTRQLASAHGDEFLNLLAQNNGERRGIAWNKSSPYHVASADAEGYFSTGALWKDVSTPHLPGDTEFDPALASDSGPTSGLENFDFGSAPKAFNTGLYLYDAETGESERLTQYTQEADRPSQILRLDLDDDGDEDLIYSMGGDIYLKENQLKTPDLRYVQSDAQVSRVDELLPHAGAVKNLKLGSDDYQSASFSFDPATRSEADSAGYELELYDSLDALQMAPEENIKRVLLLKQPELEGLSHVWVNDISGHAVLQNAAERHLLSEGDSFDLTHAVRYQAREASELSLSVDGTATSLEVPALGFVNLAAQSGQRFTVSSGSGFVIDSSLKLPEQDLVIGMEILKGETLNLESGSTVDLRSVEGADFELNHEESFELDALGNPEAPNAQIALENGAYYAHVRSLQADGSLGTASQELLLNPQLCSDHSAPFVALTQDEASVALYATVNLSAEQSFDSGSGLADATWDFDTTVDANGDGDAGNDEQWVGLSASVGPYDTLEDRQVEVTVTDAAGNQSSHSITVHVYVPQLSLSSATPKQVLGNTTPSSPSLPYHLIRERSGVLKDLDPEALQTTSKGTIEATLQDSNLVAVYDLNENKVAEFNPHTKQLLALTDAVEIKALPADGTWPSRLVVVDKATQVILGSFIISSDASLPLVNLALPLTEFDLQSFNRVTVHSYQDPDYFKVTPAELAVASASGAVDLRISNTGLIELPTARFTLKKREATSLDEPLILEIYEGDRLVLEIWPGAPESVEITTTDSLGLPSLPFVSQDSAPKPSFSGFEDLSEQDPLYTDIWDLVNRGVLEGYTEKDGQYFKPDQAINRAEFAKIILGILCITPRPEANLLPRVFSDIVSTSDWFFNYTKEAFMRSLITGYLGESVKGLAPYKPSGNITRAEAVKIMIEALEQEGFIQLTDEARAVQPNDAWYTPYLKIAQDLKPYMQQDQTAGEEAWILTPQEAADPNHLLTRYEFVQLSLRVLQAYNCFAAEEAPAPSALQLDAGIYAVTDTCNSCPCPSSIDFVADLREGDTVSAILEDATGKIVTRSNSIPVTTP